VLPIAAGASWRLTYQSYLDKDLTVHQSWTHSDKETGFFSEFTVCNEVLPKKTRFLGSPVSPVKINVN
jgi:hypothetical protein